MPPSAEAPEPPASLPPWRVFVGRARELHELDGIADDLRAGRGRLVLVTGEPGIGKTRLVEEAAARAAAAGPRVIWGQCWEAGGAPAYWPWSQVLRRIEANAGAATWRAWIAELGDALAPLAADPGAPPEPRSDAEAARFATFDAATRVLQRAAGAQPLLIVLEDLHAADLPSLLLLEFVARELADVPLVVVGTYRPADAEQRPAVALALGRAARAALRVPLAGLAPADIAALLGAGHADAAPTDLVAAVLGATAGNPLFVVETARALRDRDAGGTGAALPPGLRVASGLRDAVRSRLARLSPGCRPLIELAAVFGDQADATGLSIAGDEPVAAVLDSLREGIAAGVLADGDAGRVAFRHALLRDVLYGDLPAARRRALHLAVGRALARRHAADLDPHLAALAHHFRAGADAAATVEEALAFTVAAARRAAALNADEEAAVSYRQALDLRDRYPDGTPSRGVLLVELAEALTRVGEHNEARPVLRAATDLARAAGDAALLARAAICSAERGLGVPYRVADPEVLALCDEALAGLPSADSVLRVRLLAQAAVQYTASDAPERATATSADAVAVARRLGEPVALAHALSARHSVFWRYGAPAESTAVASEIAAIGIAIGDDDLVAQGRSWRLYDLMLGGDALAFDEDLRAFAPLAEALRRPRYRWLLENARALRALWQGRFADSEAAIAAARAQVARVGDATVALSPVAQLFALRREQGRLAEQEAATRLAAERLSGSPVPRTFLALVYVELARLDDARAAFDAVAAADFEDLRREHRLGVLPYLSEVCAALGDASRAAHLHALLAPLADRVVPYGISVAFGIGAHWLALLADTMDRHEEARAHAEHAVARHATMDAPPWLARSRLLLARLLHRSGDAPDRARGLAAAALGSARALGMDVLARDAAALLAALEPPAPPRTQPRRGVFRREGTHWTIGDGSGAPLRLRPCKGFHYIAALLGQPGRALAAVDLAGLDNRPAADTYDRLTALREQLAEAEQFQDRDRAARLRVELRQHAEQLAPAGRRRPGSTPAERARLNVTRTIGDAIRRIAAADPALGRHFEHAIRTGTLCAYVPDPRLPIDWVL